MNYETNRRAEDVPVLVEYVPFLFKYPWWDDFFTRKVHQKSFFKMIPYQGDFDRHICGAL